MKHVMAVYASVGRWECITHITKGKIWNLNDHMYPGMSFEDLSKIAEDKAIFSCERFTNRTYH